MERSSSDSETVNQTPSPSRSGKTRKEIQETPGFSLKQVAQFTHEILCRASFFFFELLTMSVSDNSTSYRLTEY